MMRATLLAAVAAIAISGSAMALVEPQPGPRDPRMRVADYAEGEVYRLVATRRSQRSFLWRGFSTYTAPT